MHYKNGREAKNGDMVMLVPTSYGSPVVGILYNAVAGNDNCNGSLSPSFGPATRVRTWQNAYTLTT